jgi:hypothetical protein
MFDPEKDNDVLKGNDPVLYAEFIDESVENRIREIVRDELKKCLPEYKIYDGVV